MANTIPLYVHWTALSWGLADRTLGSVSPQDCRNCYGTIPTLLFCHSATAPSLPSPWILIFSICNSCCQGRERRGCRLYPSTWPRLPFVPRSVSLLSYSLPQAFLQHWGSRLANDITADWDRPCWEGHRVLEMKVAFCFQHGVIFDSIAAEAGEAEMPNNELLCPVFVQLKHFSR